MHAMVPIITSGRAIFSVPAPYGAFAYCYYESTNYLIVVWATRLNVVKMMPYPELFEKLNQSGKVSLSNNAVTTEWQPVGDMTFFPESPGVLGEPYNACPEVVTSMFTFSKRAGSYQYVSKIDGAGDSCMFDLFGPGVVTAGAITDDAMRKLSEMLAEQEKDLRLLEKQQKGKSLSTGVPTPEEFEGKFDETEAE